MTDRASREETPRTKEQELDAIGMREYTNSRDALSDAYDAGRSSQAAPPTPPDEQIRPDFPTWQNFWDAVCLKLDIPKGSGLPDVYRAIDKLSDSSPAGAAPPLTAITDLPRFWHELVDAGYLCRNVQHLTASGEECDVCEKLKESRAGAAPQWVSAEDKLPETHIQVQLIRNGAFTVGYRQDSRRWCDELDVDNDGIETMVTVASKQVTHWQPLPAPPRGVTDPEHAKEK